MRVPVLALALLGCGPGRQEGPDGFDLEAFGDAFVPMYCDAFAVCDTAGRACPVTSTDSVADTCQFDPVAAQTCLDGPFDCDDTITGFEVVLVHEACSRVCL
ncbi:MAG: hypothetical protein H6737_02890 [Alphaproteobacteria bacterium]|nr:hypothetical protein [Alphaproteobacteria bacterium]